MDDLRISNLWLRQSRWLAFVLFLVATCSLTLRISTLLPFAQWWTAISAPSTDSFFQIVVHDSVIPRFCVAWICGAALGLSGAVFQQVLRAPLAEPGTLGVSAGSYLALSIVSVWAPGLAGASRELVCFGGAFAAMLVVFAIAWPHRMSPLSLILGGMVTTLICGAIATSIALFHDKGLTSLFIWGSGSLNQNDWSSVTYLLPRVMFCAIALAIAVRPLTLLGLSDEHATSLGLALLVWRVLAIVLALALAAFTVSAVGVIGFVGLAAPLIAASTGARSMSQKLVWSAVYGAGLLVVADEGVLQVARLAREFPTGGATALLGAPMLLLFLRRFRATERVALGLGDTRQVRPAIWLTYVGILLILSVALSLSLSPGLKGWEFSEFYGPFVRWRWPRLLGSLSAGTLLGLAGTVIQRLTRNPMASPEILGVSTGASFGILLLVLTGGLMTPLSQLAWASGGATALLLMILIATHRAGFRPEQVLLAGVAVNATFAGLLTTLLGLGDPRMYGVLQWMAGSTYSITPIEALISSALAIVALLVIPLAARWLAIMPLGHSTGIGLGLGIRKTQLILLLFVALTTASSTLLIGPLSFVGLMAPHMARAIGFRRPIPALMAAAMIGAAIMAVADWTARVAMYPNQLPVGVIATLIGGPYFLWLMRSRRN